MSHLFMNHFENLKLNVCFCMHPLKTTRWKAIICRIVQMKIAINHEICIFTQP